MKNRKALALIAILALVAAACGGNFNEVTCECECPLTLFGEDKLR